PSRTGIGRGPAEVATKLLQSVASRYHFAMPRRNGTDLYEDAVAHLAACHPAMARIIARVGPCTLKPKRDLFVALVNTVISQQISVRAADTSAGRLADACGGKHTPARVLALAPRKPPACARPAGKTKAMRASV